MNFTFYLGFSPIGISIFEPFEWLNNEGIKYMFDYTDNPKSNIVPLRKQKIEILNNNNVQINHSTKNINKYKKIPTPRRMQDKKKQKNNSIKLLELNFIIPKEITNYDSYEILTLENLYIHFFINLYVETNWISKLF